MTRTIHRPDPAGSGQERPAPARARGAYLVRSVRLPRPWRTPQLSATDVEGASARATADAAVRPVVAPLRVRRRTAGGRHQAAADWLDARPTATLLCDPRGRLVHANRSLVRLLEAEPDGPRLRREMISLAREVSRSMRRAPTSLSVRPVRTGARLYLLVAGPAGGRGTRGHVTVLVHPATASDDEVRDRYSLTHREMQVARLLARGERNAAIAAELGMSAHTARRHTERVLRKLGVPSRAGVAERLGS